MYVYVSVSLFIMDALYNVQSDSILDVRNRQTALYQVSLFQTMIPATAAASQTANLTKSSSRPSTYRNRSFQPNGTTRCTSLSETWTVRQKANPDRSDGEPSAKNRDN